MNAPSYVDCGPPYVHTGYVSEQTLTVPLVSCRSQRQVISGKTQRRNRICLFTRTHTHTDTASVPHTPEDFEFDLARGHLADLDGVLQGHSQGALAADVDDLVVGLDATLLAGGRPRHHFQTVDALPLTANATC